MDPKELVRAGYERAADRYHEWSQTVDRKPRRRYLKLLAQLLDPGARVLELGCGTGLATQVLAREFEVVAVDFASACLELARRAEPRASYIQADMTEVAFRAASFDAVVAFYSIIHVPRSEQPRLLQSAATWLRPHGALMVNLGISNSEVGLQDDWRGVPMYWSSYDGTTNVRTVKQAGFTIARADEVSQQEDGVEATFQWIIARAMVPPRDFHRSVHPEPASQANGRRQ